MIKMMKQSIGNKYSNEIEQIGRTEIRQFLTIESIQSLIKRILKIKELSKISAF